MADKTSNHDQPAAEQKPGLSIKRLAIGVLFFLILLIPRVRRLRRRVRLWTAIRGVAAIAAGCLGWTFYSTGGPGYLAGAVVLFLFALLVRANPILKSVDDRARELGALIVLNGGMFGPSPDEPPSAVHLFAGTERLTIEDGRGRSLGEIPMAKIHRCAAQPVEPGEGKPWELEVVWDASDPRSAKFHYEGFFAEHLARVAESTIEKLRKKELRVLP